MSPLEDVLIAAQRLLAAREDQMLTHVGWDALATAVEAATDRSADTATYDGFVDTWNDACAKAADEALGRAGVRYRLAASLGTHRRYDVAGITAAQYSAVVTELTPIGEPGVDWNFPLD